MSQMSTASSDNNAMSCSPPPHRTFEQEFLARAAVHRHHQQHHNQHQQRYQARGPQHRDVRPEDRVGGELPPASGKRGRSGSFDDTDLGLESNLTMKRLKIGDNHLDLGGGPGPPPPLSVGRGAGAGSAGEADVDYSNFNRMLGGMHWEREARKRKGGGHGGDGEDIDEDL
mmetsp:Transcript_8943/g.17938  ORF Transcript_8943/g.17938 Transcript_8943/m.17938 type:complete len:171 (+) Transcript_8943:674-1186(+)